MLALGGARALNLLGVGWVYPRGERGMEGNCYNLRGGQNVQSPSDGSA